MQYMTAYGALIMHGQISKGDFVIITAASSSVGIAAIEMVNAEGAVSIATTRTSKKEAALSSAGAAHVIATEEQDFLARVNEITGGRGARIIFDPITGKGLELVAQAAAPGGTIFEYGRLAPEPTPFRCSPALQKRSCHSRIHDTRNSFYSGIEGEGGRVRVRSNRSWRLQAAYRLRVSARSDRRSA